MPALTQASMSLDLDLSGFFSPDKNQAKRFWQVCKQQRVAKLLELGDEIGR